MGVSQADKKSMKEISFAQAQQAGPVSCEDALAIYDALEPIDTDFMLGAWKGEGFATGHPLDGVLERCHWHGKRFDSAEHVHPLVFRKASGKLTTVKPMLVMPGLGLLDRLPFLSSEWVGQTVPGYPAAAVRAPFCRPPAHDPLPGKNLRHHVLRQPAHQ
ncbi:GXWXG domain-containing protein [Alcanivorax sp.]|uniref:GXWXG domain-containing protein n=1 Tax=Alcanivorax sp. TaxID=1872427 RepID=UPI003BADA5BA